MNRQDFLRRVVELVTQAPSGSDFVFALGNEATEEVGLLGCLESEDDEHEQQHVMLDLLDAAGEMLAAQMPCLQDGATPHDSEDDDDTDTDQPTLDRTPQALGTAHLLRMICCTEHNAVPLMS